jgi:hypothetical protein
MQGIPGRLEAGRDFFPADPEGTMNNNDEMIEGRATTRFYSALVGNKRRGELVRTTLEHARHLVEIGVLEITPKKKPAGPTEKKPSGPSEKKAEDISAKKSCGAPTDGRSIDSPSSSAPGRGILSSSLGAGLRLLSAMGSSASKPPAISTGGRSRS